MRFRRALLLFSLLAMAAVSAPWLYVKWTLSRDWNMGYEDLRDAVADSGRPRPKFLCLTLAVDGVPYGVMRDLWEAGHFKSFKAPGRMVSTFPSLTRPSFSKILRGGTPYGYERLYFDKSARKVKGFNLAEKLFVTPKEHNDYHPRVQFLGFPGYIAYAFPESFTEAAFTGFKRRILAYRGDDFVAYMGLTDPIAHVRGEKKLREFLKNFDALIERTRRELDIPLRIVMFSDHGNDLGTNERVDVAKALDSGGFHRVKSPKDEKDYLLLENGLVGVAAIHTSPSNARRVCQTLAVVRGVDICVFQAEGGIGLSSLGGEARLERSGKMFRYIPITGDPLRLAAAAQRLTETGRMDAKGWAADEAWWQETKGHEYPDSLHRIWSGMNDLVQNPAEVLVSFKEGYAFGPEIFDKVVARRHGTHGSLVRSHSYGFFMTDFEDVPDFVRPETIMAFLDNARAAKAIQIANARLSAAKASR